MPNRILRDWTDSLRFDTLSPEAERLFVRLIMKADDFGRYHAEPRLLRAGCFPLSENLRTNDLIRWLDELSTRQLILCYENAGRKLLAIVNFGQRLKQSRAKFPPPAGIDADFLPMSENFRGVPGSSGKFPPEAEARKEGETETETETEARVRKRTADAVAPAPDSLLSVGTDGEWLASLEGMNCYQTLKVRTELEKAQAWASANQRPCTRGFFISWLNRAQEDKRSTTPRAAANVIRSRALQPRHDPADCKL